MANIQLSLPHKKKQKIRKCKLTYKVKWTPQNKSLESIHIRKQSDQQRTAVFTRGFNDWLLANEVVCVSRSSLCLCKLIHERIGPCTRVRSPAYVVDVPRAVRWRFVWFMRN